MRNQLSEAIKLARKTFMDGNAEAGRALKLARWLSEAARVTEELPESMHPVLTQGAELLVTASSQAPGERDLTLSQLEHLLEPCARQIHRLTARRETFRYLGVPDLVLANEIMTHLPPDYDPVRAQNCIVYPHVAPPDAEAVARGAALIEAVLQVRPFVEGNAMTALIAGLAFLQANGWQTNLGQEEAAEGLRSLLRGDATPEEWLRARAGSASPDQRVYADIIEQIARRYRESLARAEFEFRDSVSEASAQLPAKVETALQPRPGPTSLLRYLTVQDIVWINTQVTGKPQPFHFDPLEEATYYQYNYGKSGDVLGQAARFVMGFPLYKPFAAGNLGTALIAVLTFLEINGYEVHLPVEEAENWLQQIIQRQVHPRDAIRRIVRPAASHEGREVREVAMELIHRYPIQGLNG